MTELEHVEVLIVGAGLSGIGAACHLQEDRPGSSYALLEARGANGGTWDLFRYPGVRSDSDMFTLSYKFRPWPQTNAIADGPSILRYLRDTAREHGVDRKICYHRRAVSASWSSKRARWTVDIEHTDTGDRSQLSCSFLFGNTGYYRYDEGYLPKFPGTERFAGQIVHPQHWPEQLAVDGKRVVVVGSGATAVTLVPALADAGATVTMLQRSPSYILSLPTRDPIADAARRVLPPRAAYWLVRWKNVLITTLIYQLSRRRPAFTKRLLRAGVEKQLPPGYDVDTHFTPAYQPWDQRLCLVPDGDLFRAIQRGEVTVETDQIETLTERGILLASGRELAADILITATGLNMQVLGGMQLRVDGAPVDLSRTVGYKGIMLSGVPNLAVTIGYTNASWTLRADLVATYVCRLLAHMDKHGYRMCTPLGPDADEPTRPFLDLASGYVLRSLNSMPKQGTRKPWRLHQNYVRDIVALRYGSVADDAIVFAGAASTTPTAPRTAAPA